jgi:30S ribosomal protein S31
MATLNHSWSSRFLISPYLCRPQSNLANIKKKHNTMGRGDKKTKRGKIFKGSFGKARPARAARKTAAKKEA